MQYEIVSGSNPEEVKQRVNQLLAEGWELHGHLSVIPFSVHSDEGARYDYNVYTQALVKQDESGEQFRHA